MTRIEAARLAKIPGNKKSTCLFVGCATISTAFSFEHSRSFSHPHLFLALSRTRESQSDKDKEQVWWLGGGHEGKQLGSHLPVQVMAMSRIRRLKSASGRTF